MANKEIDLQIIGGGITGLAAAYIAAKNGYSVRVLEAGKSFGGLLNTFEIGGNYLEFYYHHFFTHDAEIHWLINDLGLQNQLFFQETKMGVYRDGEVHDFDTPLDLLKFKPLSFFDKFKFGLSTFFMGKWADWKKYEHIPAIEWLEKNAGKGVTESLWAPLLQIKFGPYADRIPLSWMIGRIRQRMNSRDNGDERLGYLHGSLRVLLNALIKKLNEFGVELLTEAPVQKLHFERNSLQGVETPKGYFPSQKNLMTIPVPYVVTLVKQFNSKYAENLNQIKYFGAICVILDMKKPLTDKYWLNIADKGFPFGGIIEHTNFIPPEHYNGKYIAYLSRYFAHDEQIAGMEKDKVIEHMKHGVKKIMPHFKERDLNNVYLFRSNTAAVFTDIGFSNYVPSCNTTIPNLYLCNMCHVYPDERSTNNSIRIAAESCKEIGIQGAEEVPYGNSLSGQIGFSNNIHSYA